MKKRLLYFAVAACTLAPVCLNGQVPDSTAAMKTIDSLFLLVRELTPKRQFEKAEAVCAQAASVIEKTFGTDSGPYGNYAYIYAALKINQASWDEALPYAILAKNLLEKHNGRLNMVYARSVNNLAICYRNLDNFEKAEPLYLESLGIREALYGKENTDYAMALNNIGNYYYITGNYPDAERVHLEAKEIRSRMLPEEHPDYLMSLNNLANVYSDLGNFTEAEKLYLQVKSIEEKHLETRQKDYSQTLNNLGNLYRRSENYSKAAEMLAASLELREKLLGKNHFDYIQSLENLGIVYRNMKEYGKAETIFLETCKQKLEKFGEMHSEYAKSLHNLSNVYLFLDRLDEARQLGERALATASKVLGPRHNLNTNILITLSDIYFRQHNVEAWKTSLRRLRDLSHTDVEQAQKFLSPLELENFISNQGNYTRSRSLLQFALMTADKEVYGECYDELLYQKGLQTSAGDFRRVLTMQDTALTGKYKNLQVLHRQIARQYSLPVAQRDEQKLLKLEESSNILEKELVRHIAGFGDHSRKYGHKDIQNALKKGEAAIEFAHFPKPDDNSICYAALVTLPNDTSVYFLSLFREEKLADLLGKTENSATAYTSLYAVRTGELLDATPAYGEEMYKLIWSRIDSLLKTKSVKTVYYSPSGLLNRVSFAALPVGRRKVLADQYSLNQLSSTRSLTARQPEMLSDNLSAALFGGIQYEEAGSSLPDGNIVAGNTDNLLWTGSGGRATGTGEPFSYLPGTLEEVDNLYKLLSNSNLIVQKHTGTDATEEKFKQLGQGISGSPGILHIATHGFIFPEPELPDANSLPEKNVYSKSKNPLLRSGLLLAGANKAWQGEPIAGNREDGVATAFEISKMDLSDTRIAVLSACNTGLGDLRGAEGVYGLQRAFKMAGADYLLVSLWQVPDSETAEFMSTFYTAWTGGRSVQQAFGFARKKMRKKYRDTSQWGAWVLTR